MRLATTVLIALLLLLAAAPAAALSESRAQDELDDPLNHAFAVYLGGGLYVTGDSTVFIVPVSPKIRVRDERKHRFGVRIRLTASLGYYGTGNLTIKEIPDLPSASGRGQRCPARIFSATTTTGCSASTTTCSSANSTSGYC
jgi:hypothetical protein